MQTLLFGSTPTDVSDRGKRINDCISFLESEGYVVFKPVENTYVSKISHVVDFFYGYSQLKHPERKLHYTKGGVREKQIVSQFVKKRITAGVNRKTALAECVEVIKCVLDHEDVFGLSSPLTSMGFLGQDSLKWITDRAIAIINREDRCVEHELYQEYLDRLSKEQEQQSLADLDGRVDMLRNLREYFNGKDQKK